jgi:hypothetical protein
MTNLEAAEHVLREAGTPLRAEEIARRALSARLITPDGATPEATMRAQIYMSIKRHAGESPFVQTARVTFGLREWLREGLISEPQPEGGDDVRTVFLPEYDSVRVLLPILEGTPRSLITGLRGAV